MPTELKPGFVDTPIVGGDAAAKLTAAPLNFSEDFRVLDTKSGEAVITNITSPPDRPEKIRFASTHINNVYAQSGITPERFGPTKSGRSVLIQLSDIYSVEDSTSSEDLYQLPLSAHLVIKVPNSEYVTDEVIMAHLGRLFGCLYDTGSNKTSRLKGLVRGSLLPRDVF